MLLCRKLLLNILKQDRWRGITAKRQEISSNTIPDLRCEIFKCQQPADFGTFSDRVGSIRYTLEFSWSLLHYGTKTVIASIPEPGLKNPPWWCLVAATSCVLLPNSRGQACKNKRLGGGKILSWVSCRGGVWSFGRCTKLWAMRCCRSYLDTTQYFS